MEQVQETNNVVMRGAGRSFKGTRSVVNHDYVYCMDFPGGGIYAIADGGAGTSGQDRASELAVEILREAVHAGGYFKNPEGFLIDTAEKIDRALKNEQMEENLEIAAALMMCCIHNGTAHIVYCGAGAAYLAENGRIFRLTEDVSEESIGERAPESLKEGTVPAGWRGVEFFKPLAISSSVGEKSMLLMCTGSVVSRVGNVAMQEIAQSSKTVEECADRILKVAHERENSADVSVVVVGPAGGLPESGEYVESIKYPVSAHVWKYVIVAVMALMFGTVFMYRDAIDRRQAVRELPPIEETNSVKESGGSVESSRGGKLIMPSGIVHIASDPQGARVLLNGLAEEGVTPMDLKIPADVEMTVRVEYEGLKPYEETMVLEDGVRIERILKLEPFGPNGGIVHITCVPACDRIFLDGWEVSRTARQDMLLGDVPEGKRVVEVDRGGVRQRREVSIKRGTTSELKFEMKELPKPAAVVNKPGKSDSEVMVVEPRPTPEKVESRPVTRKQPQMESRRAPVTLTIPDDSVKAVPPQPEAPDYRNQAIIVVNTNVSNSNIMVFKDGALVTTGFSGARLNLEPGRYTITASGGGSEDVTKEININSGYQVIELDLQR